MERFGWRGWVGMVWMVYKGIIMSDKQLQASELIGRQRELRPLSAVSESVVISREAESFLYVIIPLRFTYFGIYGSGCLSAANVYADPELAPHRCDP